MVGKRHEDLEGDLFPRGAAPNATPRVQKRNGQTLFGPQLKRPRLTRPTETPSDAPVIQHGASLSLSRLSVGMTVLGLITKADRSGIELVLPGGLRGTVARDEFLLEDSAERLRIGDSDGESTDDSSDEDADSVRPAWEVVNMGNIVPAAVTDIEMNDHGRRVVKLSLKPHLVNVGLNPSRILFKNFSVYGAIKSVEDHGYVISFGSNIPHTAFLPFEKCSTLAEEELVPGSPITVITVHDIKIPKKRAKTFTSAVRVSALRSEVLNSAVDAEGMTYQDLQAGMLLRSRVLQDGPGGVSLSALGVFKLDVDSSHVPRKADGSWDVTTGKQVLARLLYVDPALKRIGASLLNSYVTDLSPRAVPPHWKTGTRMNTLKVERVKSGFGLLLRYINPEGEEVVKDDDADMQCDEEAATREDVNYDVPIFAHISRVSDSKGLKLESRYHENSIIKDGARVVSISKFDGVINVDLRPSVLSRKALSLEEIEVGTVYDCKILSHTTMGSLIVAVDGDPYLPGIVLPAHISDVPIPSKRLTKNPAFRKGASIRCRALLVKWNKGKILLTARKSLVSPKYPMLTSYDQAAEALKEVQLSVEKNTENLEHALFTGITKGVTERGSLLVDFCDRVVGLVPAAELCFDHGRQSSQSQIESLYPIGETVHVRLLKADAKKRRMLLSMSLEARKGKTSGKKAFQLGQRVQATISAVDPDSRYFVVFASARHLDAQGDDRTNANSGSAPGKAAEVQSKAECHLPFGHLSDNAGVAERLASELQLRLKGLGAGNNLLEMPEAMVLCYREGIPILTMKTSLITTEESGRLPKSFDEVRTMNAPRCDSDTGSSVLRGYVKALLPSGVIVGFLGDCVGFVRNSRVADRFISDPARSLNIHQSVSAAVESVDESNKRFALSMRPSDVGQTGIEADTCSLFKSLEAWQRVLSVPQIGTEFQIGGVTNASVNAVSTYGVKYDLKSPNATAIGVAYGVTGTAADVVMESRPEFREKASLIQATNSKLETDSKTSTVERVRVLDVDPLTGVVDLSRDEKVVSEGEKKSVITPGSSFGATILLVKSAYLILAVKRSKSRTAIAYALGPVTQENLMIRPGGEVQCVVLDKTHARTRRNLVIVDWASFRGTRKEVQLRSTLRDSECSKTISILRASANVDETSLVGMQITGKVTRRFRLHAYVGIAPGIVGQIHITNTSCMPAEDLTQTPLGMAPAEITSRYILPGLGRHLKPAYLAGVRRAADQGDCDPLVVELSLSKARCFNPAPSEGEKVLGFVKRPSSRFTSETKSGKEKELFRHTLVAINPATLVSCADVDCLFNEERNFAEGSPVVCQLIGVNEDGTGRVRGTLSDNGEQKGKPFLGLVQSVHPGRGLRVSIPWHARGAKSKSVSWGYVDICDVADDFDEAVEIMQDVTPGSTVKIQTMSTTRDLASEGKCHVWLSMRASEQSRAKDPLLTTESLDCLKEGSPLRGFVQGIGKKGCFVSIGRNVSAQVKLCDLSDEFVKDPQREFPVGKLVSGLVGNVIMAKDETRITLVLRKRPRKKLRTGLIPSELKEGSKVSGEVRRIAEYGALIEIAPGLTALLHKSEADQDRFIKDPQEEWSVGQKLTGVVIKIVDGKVNIGTKRCYFQAAGIDEFNIDELLTRNEEARHATKKYTVEGDREENSEHISARDEGRGIEVELKLNNGSDGESETRSEPRGSSRVSNETTSEIDIITSKQSADFHDPMQARRSVAPLAVLGGFDFTETLVRRKEDESDSDVESREQNTGMSDLQELPKSSSRTKREKKRLREAAERDIRLREEALANNPNAPETGEDFERLLLGEPNSSVMWIRYMAFCVQLSQIDKARSIAERALETISLQAESERVNVWCAYVNLEAQFGSMNATEPETNDAFGAKRAAAVFRVFERACERITDVKNFHLQTSSALRRTFPGLADEILRRAVRRFKGSREVWIAIGQSHFAKGDIEVARKTLERALMTLDKRKHVRLITKFAQFEYKYGNPERGRTVFESLVGNFPRRVDLWNIYLDMETSQCLKAGGDSTDDYVKRSRQLFERFTSMDLNSKKMKFGFKKWLRFEKTYGTKENEADVKNRARSYVDRNVTDA